MRPLEKKRVAILATDGFEQSELLEPLESLRAAGARVDVIAPKAGTLRGWSRGDWGKHVDVDVELSAADFDRYDGLVLPGGVINADHLRAMPEAVGFVRAFVASGKPLAAICHAPWALIEARAVEGRTLTSFHTLQTDLKNAGAQWVDEEVVVDGALVTSRKPDDLPAFNQRFAALLAGEAPPQATDLVQDEIDTARRTIDAKEIEALLSEDHPTTRSHRPRATRERKRPTTTAKPAARQGASRKRR